MIDTGSKERKKLDFVVEMFQVKLLFVYFRDVSGFCVCQDRSRSGEKEA